MAGCRTTGTNLRSGESLDSAHEECECLGLSLRQGGERTALVAAKFPTTTSAGVLAQDEQILWPCSLHITARHWIWDGHNSRKESHRTEVTHSEGRTCGAVVAIVGNYSSSVSEAAQISEGSCSSTFHTLIYAKSPYGPCLPCAVPPQQGKDCRGWGQ